MAQNRQEIASGQTTPLAMTDTFAVYPASRLLDDPAAHRAMARAVNPCGDGRAAARIVAALLEHE